MISVFSLLLIVHITAGTLCLFVGAIAMFSRKRKGVHTNIGEVYHFGYIIIFLTAVAMSIMMWSQLQYLFYIALFSYAQALYGYLARKLRWNNWLRKHISGMLGSYIGIITAVLVVNGKPFTSLTGIPQLFLWFIPAIIGTPCIILTINRFTRPLKKAL
jgi:hypothetical protein